MKCRPRLEHGWIALLLIGLGILLLRALLVADSVLSIISDMSASSNDFYDLPVLLGNNTSLFSFWKNELKVPNASFFQSFSYYGEHVQLNSTTFVLVSNATLSSTTTSPMANHSGHENGQVSMTQTITQKTTQNTKRNQTSAAKTNNKKKNPRQKRKSQSSKEMDINNNNNNSESRSYNMSVYENDTTKKKNFKKQRERELPPFVLEQYIQWHSVDALRADPHNRLYAIGHYACPVQAGNRINQFLNALLWAIVTNRTLLWDYFDPDTCHHYLSTDPRFAHEVNETNICQFMKLEADCAQVLTRASWIPSYQDYKDILGEPHVLHYWSTSIPSQNIPEGYRVNSPSISEWNEKYAGVDQRYNEIPLIMFPIQPGHDNDLDTRARRNTLLKTAPAIRRAWQLYKYGKAFVYGMLFRSTFDFRQPLTMQKAIERQVTNETFTIAIHSRHQLTTNFGSNIASELKCMDRIFKITNRTLWTQTRPCAVFLMSDREITLRKLKEYLKKQYNCTPYVLRASKSKPMARSFSIEHGSFAGAAFFQDLQLLSNARHAFIGGTRSSSTAMALSLVEYDRRMKRNPYGHDDSKWKDFEICDLIVNANQHRPTPWLKDIK